ncbi:MAG: hypothetical protein ACLFQS_04310 [Bacteroidales bacterium]
MENNYLKNLWKESEKKSSDYYSSIEKNLIEKAKSTSNDLFNRIYRKAIIELWLSGIIALAIPWMFFSEGDVFWIVSIILIVIIGLTIWFYMSFLTKLKNIQQHNIIDALQRKEETLSRFVLWQYILVVFGLLVGFAFGLFSGGNGISGFKLTEDWLKLLTAALLLGGISWLLQIYVHVMYGKPLQELRQLLSSLKEHYSNGEIDK